jgi:hypothetical protein
MPEAGVTPACRSTPLRAAGLYCEQQGYIASSGLYCEQQGYIASSGLSNVEGAIPRR